MNKGTHIPRSYHRSQAGNRGGKKQSGNPCSDGTPTWPGWVPSHGQDYSDAELLARVTDENPGRNNSAGLIYLGWAAHMIQDLANIVGVGKANIKLLQATNFDVTLLDKAEELSDTLPDHQQYSQFLPGQWKDLSPTAAYNIVRQGNLQISSTGLHRR